MSGSCSSSSIPKRRADDSRHGPATSWVRPWSTASSRRSSRLAEDETDVVAVEERGAIASVLDEIEAALARLQPGTSTAPLRSEGDGRSGDLDRGAARHRR